MNRADILRLSFGLTDLVLAVALAASPALLGTDGCGAALVVIAACLGAAPVALVGMWMLAAPRSGSVAAITLGLLATAIAGWCAATEWFTPYWTPDNWVALGPMVPAILQLPFGWWLRRALPPVRAVSPP